MKMHLFFLSTILSFLICGCSSSDFNQQNYDVLLNTNEQLQASLESMSKEFSNTSESYEKQVESLVNSLSEIESEYASYKESMQEYEDLSAAEAEARKIQAESIAESEAAAKAAAESEAAAKAESEEKAGYETGITYDQLARTPDDYKGKLVKFTGTVLQVIEGGSEIQIRFAVNDDYDTVLYCGYSPDIVSYRILEDDTITIYGKSLGLISYETTLGSTITIPAVSIDKIDQ